MTTTRPAWIDDGSPIDDPFGYGERAVQWLRKLKHPKSRAPGQAFTLDPWQERIIRKIYGPRKVDGTRIVKRVCLLLPRGNRKTSLAAAITLLHLRGPEKVPGALIQSAASARKQARECFEEVALIVNGDKRLRPHFRVQDYKNRVVYPEIRTRYEAISADAGVQHGSTPTVVIADELHAWKSRALWDVLSSALNKTTNTLMVVATTAGRGEDNVAFETIDYARKVQAGEVVDPTFLPVLFEASKDADFTDPVIWHAVNPGLAYGYPSIDALQELAERAVHVAGDRAILQQLHLNVWLDHSHTPFVDLALYDEGAGEVDLERLEHEQQPCFLAVDLSSNSDLTVIVACWVDQDGSYLVHPFFFCPAENVSKRDTPAAPYTAWVEGGFIVATEGYAVDYGFVRQRIVDLCAQFNVQQVGFDRWHAREMQAALMDDGLPVVDIGQGFKDMAPAIRELERAIIARQFYHGGHPVLRWNFENIALATDPAGNQKFNKAKSRDKIDGAVATAMAVKLAAANDNSPSALADPDFIAKLFGT